MAKNKNADFHVIPMKKGYVKGYYEKRDGRLVWVSPYENSKDHKPNANTSGSTTLEGVKAPKLPKFDPNNAQQPAKPMMVATKQDQNFDFLLNMIVNMVRQIDGFDPGEIARLKPALREAKSIISELGYMDDGVKLMFNQHMAVKPTRLGSGPAREVSGMSKDLTRAARRVVRASLRVKVQKMAEYLQEAL